MSSRRGGNEVWWASGIYALGVVVFGFAARWTAKLTFDEETFYAPAVAFFAERLPAIPLNYPMPFPPAGIYLQAVLWQVLPSFALLRAATSVAAIALVLVVAHLLRGQSSLRAALLVLMVGTLPTFFLSAFLLKLHALAILCNVAAFALWERRRSGWAAVALTVGMTVQQTTLATTAALTILTLLRDGRVSRQAALKSAFVLGLSFLPIAILFAVWGGFRPPMYAEVFQEDAGIGRLHARQLIVLLLMIGVWIAPVIGSLRSLIRLAAASFPFALLFTHVSGVMKPGAPFMSQIAGPVSSSIEALGGGMYGARLAGTALLVAFGMATVIVSLLDRTLDPVRLWSLAVWTSIFGCMMLTVPYYFESYYALYVIVAWLIVRWRLLSDPSRSIVVFQTLAISAGLVFVLLKSV
ncbi:MAG: hypothetical protein WA208_09540 [Thermoanaerobaculia bacterium]